ncbi:hypothetical protein [Desulfosarcina ovata]|uniref:Methyl-accepting chemotaxis protein n=2 Tax=Desulfosarcina ovata TaxID=83564 RepID=A0A5K8ACZ6_9BACT|nr:hypothetical protein [Desulfosarcina ovata]BBO83944.1 hypothetical protein DSCO28_45100 [Desulfosarcina ovata subsp. sediminis]BBO90421.1 hypothetical protein DSCOOX_36010 [Desulfosarcina ovata subsp. ovata]
MNHNVSQSSAVSTDIAKGSTDVLKNADSLAKMAEQLNHLVGRFKM